MPAPLDRTHEGRCQGGAGQPAQRQEQGTGVEADALGLAEQDDVDVIVDDSEEHGSVTDCAGQGVQRLAAEGLVGQEGLAAIGGTGEVEGLHGNRIARVKR